jgi:NAD(P)-dependent dehydrogenase (short-subunit alcohol dehydrogenase family)
MSRVFVTGSSTGLGRATAAALLAAGHQAVVHARNSRRAIDLADLARQGASIVVGDLSVRADVVDVAHQVNALGPMDAVVHNAGVYVYPAREETVDGHPHTLAVNVLAPYLLTVLIERPDRLVYLSSGMHRSGGDSLDDLDWRRRPWDGVQAYCDAKLYLTALAMAVARLWPMTRSNAVDPGWVPTRMGGAGAPDDLTLGHLTQTWLAAGDDSDADVTGGYWFHRRQERPAAAAGDTTFQAALLSRLAQLTGVEFPRP